MLKNDHNILKSVEFASLKKIVVFFHGYGSKWEDFPAEYKKYLSDEMKDTILFAPNAPFRCDAGFGYQWFKLSNMSVDEIRSGMDEVVPIVANYIDSLAKEFECNDISIIGFSQGAMLSFEMLHYIDVSKIVAFSGMFIPSEKPIVAKNANVLIVHSDDDVSVPYLHAPQAKNDLDRLEVKSQIETCHGIGHSISQSGLRSCVNFLYDN
jgi:phospholipase/carboxylesterase